MKILKRTSLKFALCFLIFSSFFGATFLYYQVFGARAGTDDFFRGWIWNDNVGWISVNCADTGTCGVIDYGVDMNLATGDITGYAWSENAGWVCFGSTCGGTTPEGGASYAGWDSVTHEIGGWARAEFEVMPDESWISLNCLAGGNCLVSDYKVMLDPYDDDVEGWAWNANSFGGILAGLGWSDFDQVFGTKELLCDDFEDNDSDGLIDCQDPDCACDYEKEEDLCTDAINNDADAWTDCLDHEPDHANSCWQHDPYCPVHENLCYVYDGMSWVLQPPELCCRDFIDNDYDNGYGAWDPDFNSGTDCLDTDCQPWCLEDCFDGFDNDGDGLIDLADPDCEAEIQGVCDPDHCDGAPCTIIDDICGTYIEGGIEKNCLCIARPWLETQLGHVYAEQGLRGPKAPESKYNATFCVVAVTGGIEHFTSSRDCYLTPDDAYVFPQALNKFTNILGHLDVPGIINGLYGPVVNIDEPPDIPGFPNPILGGKVYYVIDHDIDFGDMMQIANGIGNQSGGGTIIVEGNINIDADITYDPASISKLKNLASLGWIAVEDPVMPYGGEIHIGGDVQILVGAFYAENLIWTKPHTNPLTVYGLMISKNFDFNRQFSSGERGAEQIILDGRALTNPPPGFEDLIKSLPVISEIVPPQ